MQAALTHSQWVGLLSFLDRTKAHRFQHWRDDLLAEQAYYAALRTNIRQPKREHYRPPRAKAKARVMTAAEVEAAMRASLPANKR